MKAVSILYLLILTFPLVMYLSLPLLPARHPAATTILTGSRYDAGPLTFRKQALDVPFGHPRITNVQVTDLNSAGVPGVLVCDAGKNAVIFSCPGSIDKNAAMTWRETVVAKDLSAPAHATVVDIDKDGDQDVVVAVLGNIEPDDGVVGKLVLLEYREGVYAESVILDDVRRVADAQPGDFDGDGDTDLAVAVFGYNRGQVLWLENCGDGRFRDHELLAGPGIIHVPVADFDNDGDLDIAACVTQDEEEVWIMENVNSGQFLSRRIWFTHNFDLGTAGLLSVDLDQDGDLDFVLPAGDNLEDFDPFPQPYHGCYWLKNNGDWNYSVERISELGGTYGAATGDLDGDGDVDIALVSMANVWDQPGRASLVWLENDGECRFRTWQVDSSPTHLVTVSIGDLNGDGINDIVAGGLHIRGPYHQLGSVTVWLNDGRPLP